MAEDICSFNKEGLTIKAPKKSPLALRMVLLAFAMICGVYICSVCLKQRRTPIKTKFLNVPLIEQPPPMIEQPLINRPMIEQPLINRPMIEQPLINRPMIEQPLINRPMIEQPLINRPMIEQPLIDPPMIEQPLIDPPMIEQPLIDRPCNASGIEQWEIPYVHYPKPETYSREECACNPVRYFAILSMQRSGSGWFETLLNNHTNVSSNGEIFSVRDRRSNVSSILKTMDQVYNLDWLSSASKNECSAAVGFKWMLNQGLMEHHEEIVEYFNGKGVSAIFLFRKNLLRRMISVLANSHDKDTKLLNGTHKSHVHSPAEAKILAKFKPKINATLLIPDLKQVEETTAKAIEYFKSTRHIVLNYEDLIKNHTKLFEVQEFLRLPYRDLKSRQVKIHSGPLSSQVENWDDIQKALKGTSYESFIHADHKM